MLYTFKLRCFCLLFGLFSRHVPVYRKSQVVLLTFLLKPTGSACAGISGKLRGRRRRWRAAQVRRGRAVGAAAAVQGRRQSRATALRRCHRWSDGSVDADWLAWMACGDLQASFSLERAAQLCEQQHDCEQQRQQRWTAANAAEHTEEP